ncbi:hypothetical protein KIV63_gp33 [Mycobacterium phage SWU2]|uniref:Uncharacterized protein n=1 Tax=Mycobacterium phage SWU2 TaxID=2077150 RepID=A0A2K9VI34_9CAUD|nr:hypothetical protein KIV63_gp33 [Mycobacterium phage SWU2]AUV62011.1 hypothetical protein JX_gp52 [Mycobacterium phage SWU2]
MNDLITSLVQGEVDVVSRQINWQRARFEEYKRQAHDADQELGELLRRKNALLQALGTIPSEPKPEPRTWESYKELPMGVLAISSNGVLHVRRRADGKVEINAVSNNLNPDGWVQTDPGSGPLTEVLEGSK